jgi:membrane-associated phospholipid phosphatase
VAKPEAVLFERHHVSMIEQPRPTNERIWLSYLTCVFVVCLCTASPGASVDDRQLFLWVHLPIIAAVILSYWVATRRSHAAASWLRAAIAIIGLPTVFSALCWLLPEVHPEPYEFVWLEVDFWLFGGDLASWAGVMPAWLIELLQYSYVSFYAICIGSALIVRWQSGAVAFDRTILLLVGGFLSSYLGYLLFPTIAPKVVLEQPFALEGLWFTETLRVWIDAAEANPWDCFPSGHTMLTITSLICLWRWARPWFWVLLLPGLLLIASTILLRYHWVSDALAGALWAWPCAWLCDWLANRDHWPQVALRLKRE